ncbi:hypothetical protein ACM66B_003446 [Microbotryomycetes sp. NB124-2]
MVAAAGFRLPVDLMHTRTHQFQKFRDELSTHAPHLAELNTSHARAVHILKLDQIRSLLFKFAAVGVRALSHVPSDRLPDVVWQKISRFMDYNDDNDLLGSTLELAVVAFWNAVKHLHLQEAFVFEATARHPMISHRVEPDLSYNSREDGHLDVTGHRWTLERICRLEIPSLTLSYIQTSERNGAVYMTEPKLLHVHDLFLLQQETFDLLIGRFSFGNDNDGDGAMTQLSPRFFKKVAPEQSHLAVLLQILSLAKAFRTEVAPQMAYLLRTGIVPGATTAESAHQTASSLMLGTWYPPRIPATQSATSVDEQLDQPFLSLSAPLIHDEVFALFRQFLSHVDNFYNTYSHAREDRHVKMFASLCNGIRLPESHGPSNSDTVHSLQAFEVAGPWSEKLQVVIGARQLLAEHQWSDPFQRHCDPEHRLYDFTYSSRTFLPYRAHLDVDVASLSLRTIRRTGISPAEFRQRWTR